MTNLYKKIKAQNGEKFAQAVRKHAPLCLDKPETVDILRHAGRNPEDVTRIATAIHKILMTDSGEKTKDGDPLELMAQAGYDAYYVTDKKSQNAIKKYFAPGEELCTFRDERWKTYKVINAVKKGAGELKRADFKNPRREDDYGISVISIQVKNGFISIKNRYNHKVPNCDATFGNDLDAIIPGLRAAVEDKFKIKIGSANAAPDGFMLVENKIFKVIKEINGVYYGDTAVIKDGEIMEMAEHDYLYEYFVFNMKDKKLRLFDKRITDSFPDDFNRAYGGNPSLRVDRHGNLCDGDIVLFGVER